MTDCFIVIEHQSDQWDNLYSEACYLGYPLVI